MLCVKSLGGEKMLAHCLGGLSSVISFFLSFFWAWFFFFWVAFLGGLG